jgi:hypothetical protein
LARSTSFAGVRQGIAVATRLLVEKSSMLNTLQAPGIGQENSKLTLKFNNDMYIYSEVWKEIASS